MGDPQAALHLAEAEGLVFRPEKRSAELMITLVVAKIFTDHGAG